MEMTVIVNVIEIVLYIILGGIAIWFKTNAKINKAVNGLIDKAEDEFTGFKQGNEKFQAVTDWIYEIIPSSLKAFFPKKFIEELIQNAFEQSASYAKKQLDKVVDKALDKEKE